MTRKRKISKVAVARAAARVTRRSHLDAVTVRGMAAELDVVPMALYRHIGSAAGLRLATIDYVLTGVKNLPAEGDVRDRLRSFAVDARAVLSRYPGVPEAVLTEWPGLVQGARLMESLLGAAAEVTVDATAGVDIAHTVFVEVLMRVIAERAVLARPRRKVLPVVRDHPERFPRLAATRGDFAALDLEQAFLDGVGARIDALLTSG